MQLNKQVALQLLGKDSINWSEMEGEYHLLSDKETEELVNCCVDSGMTKDDDIMKVVRLYEDSITLSILFRNFLNGDIVAKIEDGQVMWAKINK